MKGKEIYYKRKEAGLCTRCGGELEENRKGKVLCEGCARRTDSNKNLDTKNYIEVGICPLCKTHRLVGDEQLCFECHEKKIARQKKYREKQRESDPEGYKSKNNEAVKRTQQKRKEQGLCIRCGNKKNTHTLLCEKCKQKDKKRWQEKRGVICDKSLRAELGLCVNCGQPAYSHFKLCKNCYEKNCQGLENMKLQI